MNKMFKLLKDPKIILFILIGVGCFLRIYNLNWDNGYFLHPDERLYINSSGISVPKDLALLFSPDSPLNSKEFSYGSLPLFVYKLAQAFIFPTSDFLFVSRLISSMLSILTIPLLFLLSKELFGKKVGIVTAAIFTFSPGSIQHAHFNTTESILIFFVVAITLLSIKAVKNKNYLLFIILGILIGTSYASKITGLTFIILPIISFIYLFFKNIGVKKIILLTLLFLLSSTISGAMLAPYQIIDFNRFIERQEEEQNVVYGKYKRVYTMVYEQTKPYIYPFIQVLPFSFGFISLPLSLMGLIFILKMLKEKKENKHIYLFILIYPILYFLWAGAWYAKFSRYYVLLIPFLSVWASVALVKFKKPIFLALLFLITVNGLLYLNIYIKPHTRVAASSWIYENIPTKSVIAGEHWDDNLPLPLAGNYNKQYTMSQLAVYDQDSQEKISKISESLSQSDYFIISSRRVYYSILRNEKKYPLTSRFYKLLFEEKLGYRLEKTFTNYPFYFSDDFADESFQSYDHPPVLIFQNQKKFDYLTILKLINGN